MRKLYFFFDNEYEQIVHNPNMPFRLILESVGFIGPHWHPDTEILFMLKGKATVTVSRGRFDLAAGDIMIVNANEMHSLVEQEENILLVCQLDSALLCPPSAPAKEFLLPEGSGDRTEPTAILKQDIAKLWFERHYENKGFESFCLSAFYHLLGTIQREVPFRTPQQEKSREALHQIRIKKIMDYLHEHYHEKLTLAGIAEEFHVSPNYLSHLIKKESGYSFQENLSLIRTGKAIDLLMQTDKKLLEISMEVGYSDPKYFNQSFKTMFGMTPKQLKRNPDWQSAILKHFKNDGLPSEDGIPLLQPYLD